MPRNVRNFWIEAEIDGREHPLAGGPKSKDGGFTATVKMRHGGTVLSALKIDGYPITSDGPDKGKILLTVHNLVDKITWFIETRR